MDLGRIEVEARPGPNGHPVAGRAVGRGPEARIDARGGQVRAPQGIEVPPQSRVDRVADDLGDPPPACPVAGGQAGAGHDRRRLDGQLQQPLELGDRALGHDAGRRHAAAPGLVQELDVGVDERAERGQARQQRLEAGWRVGGLELDLLPHDRLRPVDLVDQADEVHAQGIRLVAELAHDPQHVVGDPLLDRELVGRDRGQLGERGVPQRAAGGASGGRRVVEAVVPALVAVDGRQERVLGEVRVPEPVDEGGESSVGRGHRSSGRVLGRGGACLQARTASRRMDRGSFPWRRTSSWKQRRSNASPSRAVRSRRRRWISRRPVM